MGDRISPEAVVATPPPTDFDLAIGAGMPSVRSLARGLGVIRLLNQRDGMTTAQVAAKAGLSRGTAYRLLLTFRSHGYLRFDEDTGRYWLTPKVLTLSHGFDDELWPTRIARPLLQALTLKVGWPVAVGSLHAGAILVQESSDDCSPMVFNTIRAGYRMSVLHSAAGWIVLAYAAPAQRALILSGLDESASGPDGFVVAAEAGLEERLARIRRDGFLVHIQPKVKQTLIAAPILRGSEPPTSVLSLRFFTSAMSESAAVAQYLPLLKQTAGDIAARLEAEDLA